MREFGDDKADVIMKYYEEEAKELKELGEIPEHVKINEVTAYKSTFMSHCADTENVKQIHFVATFAFPHMS